LSLDDLSGDYLTAEGAIALAKKFAQQRTSLVAPERKTPPGQHKAEWGTPNKERPRVSTKPLSRKP
jgi:hypothetical protein